MMGFFIKASRVSSWILLLSIVFFFVSGFGVTKGIIDPKVALTVHHDILPYIILAALIFHAGFGMRMAFVRWRIWNLAGKILLVLIIAGFAGFFVWAEYFYEKNYQNTNNISDSPIFLNFQEIGKHNNAQDCWLLIDGRVYNVTSFIGLHPGGAGEIIPNCGKDATIAFKTKISEQESHSEYAVNLLKNYLIGNINQTIYLNK